MGVVILGGGGGGGGGGGAPSGAAGGVLGGLYPNPGFAVDMATQAELDAAVATRPVATKVADYQLVLTDAGTVVALNKATAVNVTVPANATVAFPVGSIVDVVAYGLGPVSFVAAGGVTLRSMFGSLTIPDQYGLVRAIKLAADEWLLAPAVAGAGLELGYAELSADPTAATTTKADITNLSLTFNAPLRAFMVDLYVPIPSPSAAPPTYTVFEVADSANTTLEYTTYGAAGSQAIPVLIRVRLPRVGGTAYPITPGNSYTFKARWQTSAGTCGMSTVSGVTRPCIRAVTC